MFGRGMCAWVLDVCGCACVWVLDVCGCWMCMGVVHGCWMCVGVGVLVLCQDSLRCTGVSCSSCGSTAILMVWPNR